MDGDEDVLLGMNNDAVMMRHVGCQLRAASKQQAIKRGNIQVSCCLAGVVEAVNDRPTRSDLASIGSCHPPLLSCHPPSSHAAHRVHLVLVFKDKIKVHVRCSAMGQLPLLKVPARHPWAGGHGRLEEGQDARCSPVSVHSLGE